MPISRISDRSLQMRRFGFINRYLVREAGGLTPIDTGMAAARIILETAQQGARGFAAFCSTPTALEQAIARGREMLK